MADHCEHCCPEKPRDMRRGRERLKPPTSEWAPLYRAEKARADELAAKWEDARATIRRMDAATLGALDRAFGRQSDLGSVGGIEALAAERDAAEAAVARVRALCEQWSDDDDETPPLLTFAGAAVAVRAALDAT